MKEISLINPYNIFYIDTFRGERYTRLLLDNELYNQNIEVLQFVQFQQKYPILLNGKQYVLFSNTIFEQKGLMSSPTVIPEEGVVLSIASLNNHLLQIVFKNQVYQLLVTELQNYTSRHIFTFAQKPSLFYQFCDTVLFNDTSNGMWKLYQINDRFQPVFLMNDQIYTHFNNIVLTQDNGYFLLRNQQLIPVAIDEDLDETSFAYSIFGQSFAPQLERQSIIEFLTYSINNGDTEIQKNAQFMLNNMDDFISCVNFGDRVDEMVTMLSELRTPQSLLVIKFFRNKYDLDLY